MTLPHILNALRLTGAVEHIDRASHQAIRHGFRQARLSTSSRHRDIARALELTEGELIAAHCCPFNATQSPLKARRLRNEWPQIIDALEPLGEVHTSCGNASCVHETVGVYAGSIVDGSVGRVFGQAFELRAQYSRWAHGFAVEERLADAQVQRSLQVFDAQGRAVHKITLLPGSWVAAFFDLVEDFASLRLAAGITLAAPAAPPAETPDAAVDVRSLRLAWASMRSTGDFDALLRRLGVSHVQALRLAPPDYVQALPVASAHEVLTRAAQQGVAVRVSVGNPGVIQTHSGPLQHVVVSGPWISVLDPGFKLLLREDHIASAWLVKRPTRDGLVHALELFDATGQAIAVFAGEQHAGHAERCDWRSLLLSLSADAEAPAGAGADLCAA